MTVCECKPKGAPVDGFTLTVRGILFTHSLSKVFPDVGEQEGIKTHIHGDVWPRVNVLSYLCDSLPLHTHKHIHTGKKNKPCLIKETEVSGHYRVQNDNGSGANKMFSRTVLLFYKFPLILFHTFLTSDWISHYLLY